MWYADYKVKERLFFSNQGDVTQITDPIWTGQLIRELSMFTYLQVSERSDENWTSYANDSQADVFQQLIGTQP